MSNGIVLIRKMDKNTTNRNGATAYEEPVRRGPKKFNFWREIYNKDKNYILGRTPQNWGQLFIFYAVFYIILAILFAICMKGLMSTLDDKTSRWILSESRIGDNPGLGFRPMPTNKSQGSLIWMDTKNVSTVKSYVEIIDKFLSDYESATMEPHENSVNCGFGSPPPEGKVCRVSLGQFGKCTASNSYGYNSSQPCIFLKLNRIFNWQPEMFMDSYPDRMPNELKQYIGALPAEEKKQVFVSCEGQHPVDKENIGKITVLPKGFPYYFYPYTIEAGYLSPLVAVQFESPTKNKVINIECIAWASNIVYHGGERGRQGSIHFELLIDN